MRTNKDSLLSVVSNHLVNYPTPVNFNYFFGYGSLSLICLLIQITSGVLLAMHYIPSSELAFLSVEHIMRDVQFGWLLRYAHANGASMFFICLYIHMLRSLYYGSFIYPRNFTWITGSIIFILTIATAFLGYVLPWGQMSFWAATVITNLFSAIPFVGESIVEWLWGGFSVSSPTLNRFFSLHFLLPFVIAGFVGLHLAFLHRTGSNNPLTVDSPTNTVNFYPYFFIKDLLGVEFFVLFFSYLIYNAPNILGHPDNYIYADPLSTPAHIVPEWYFLPLYAILRSVPDKLGGVICMAFALLIIVFLPRVYINRIKGCAFFVQNQFWFWFFGVNGAFLGWLGQKEMELPYLSSGVFGTAEFFILGCVLIASVNTFKKIFKNLQFKFMILGALGLSTRLSQESSCISLYQLCMMSIDGDVEWYYCEEDKALYYVPDYHYLVMVFWGVYFFVIVPAAYDHFEGRLF